MTFKTQPGIAVHKVLQVQSCGLTGLARTCKLQGGAKSFHDLEGLARVEGWKCGSVEEWKGGVVKGWKGGRVEEWKGGRVEGW